MRKGYTTKAILLFYILILVAAAGRIMKSQTPEVPVSDTIARRIISQYVTISPYDTHFRAVADSMLDCDWKLLAAIAFTESRFDSTAVSGVGASGVMQVMPRTMRKMGIPDSLHLDTRSNIIAAATLIKDLNHIFRRIEDPNEKINFVLASYNAGIGQVSDAMRLAQKYGRDRYKWENNVDTFLILKSEPEYYNDSICKNGQFKDHKQTLQFIKKVKRNWNKFNRMQQAYSDSIENIAKSDSII